MTLPSITPVQTNVLAALRSFIIDVLPAGVEVVRGQVNRVAGPLGPDYVVITPILIKRLETNVDLYADCAFTGSISGTTLTVSAMLHGTITVGNQLFGSGISSTVFVSGTISGTGGIGTYLLSGTLGVTGPETMATGVLFAMQPAEITVQIDVYGPDSPDYAQIISTLFRDDYAVEFFKTVDVSPPPSWADVPVGGTLSVPYTGIAPLYADDPRQMTQIFGEQQYEIRWSVDACLQANQIVTVGQMFAGAVRINPIEADIINP